MVSWAAPFRVLDADVNGLLRWKGMGMRLRFRPGLFRICVLLVLLSGGLSAAALSDRLAVRVENFTVPPSTGPLTHILIHNSGETAQEVTVQPRFPTGWKWTPQQRTLTIAPEQTERVPFTIEKATDLEANRYPVEVAVTCGTNATSHRQTVVCASAPYSKPKIDGKFKDWPDAIPLTFTTEEKDTIVSTYWDKRNFYLYVQVEEGKLRAYKKGASVVDAVQFAIAPRSAVTPDAATAPAQRHEFLLVGAAGPFAKAKCFSLIKAGNALSVAAQYRALSDLAELDGARVVVKRRGKTTHYECAIPFAALSGIRPDVGREIRLSLMVHDPDGTGRRDWGKAAGLWANQRNPLAWCAWGQTSWAEDPPYDSKTEWGLCSSKH